MLLSLKWLNEFITPPDYAPEKYVADLTMSGSMVEGYKIEGEAFDKIVVGKVLSVEKHPNADTLYICKVDAGTGEPIQIVTGADNVVPDAWVPVALDGSTVAGGKKIKKGKLRGEISNGMLCSLEELGLTHGDFPYANPDGIFLLEEPDLAIGQDIREAIGLNDTIFEFEITSNRPDCLSVHGLARETAATYGQTMVLPSPSVKGGAGNVRDLLSVTVANPKLCLHYAAAAVKNVRIGPSPRWMRERLRASGVRPINNIVDITNYVMLEYGQPMHAFDLKHVKGAKIVVRNASPDERITTLDGVERTLSPEMLVIADESSPSAVAGIMGGEWSGIYDTTETVIFESACFNGPSVRTTAKKLGMRTESSGRFEKGLDPENCIPALKRACELVELLGAGDVADGFIDEKGEQPPVNHIPLDVERINALLGLSLPREEMVRILRLLDFRVEEAAQFPGVPNEKNAACIVEVPSFRADVEGIADIAEEVARIYGYDNIPNTALRGLAQGRLTVEQQFSRMLNDALLAQGYNEIITYSFISPKYYDKIALPVDSPLRDSVVISNPLGEDTSIMRTTALPSMLETLARNYAGRVPDAWLFELATVYLPTKPNALPLEKKQVMLGLYGAGADFYALKGAVEVLLGRAGIADWEVRRETANPSYHPGRCATLHICGEFAGTLGEVHPSVCEAYEIGVRACVAELDFNTMLAHHDATRTFRHLPRFPASTRDLALVCDEIVPACDIVKALQGAIGKILESATLFDVYRGAQVGERKKSIAYALVLRAEDHTLTDEECDKAVSKALKALENIGVTLRK